MSSFENPVLLFDGVCNLCNASVQFILKHERCEELRFASLQSDAGTALLRRRAFKGEALASLVLVKEGQVYTESDAVLQVCAYLKAPWPVFRIFRFLPKALRDVVYRFIARHRYQWFGKRASCMLPGPELAARFL